MSVATKKLSIIIVNFNTVNVLKECLINLQKSSDLCEVYVVDNASQDGSIELVKSEFLWVNLICNQENLGSSKAANIALNKVTTEYVLFLGSDAFPSTETLLGLIKYFEENQKCAIATTALYTRDGFIDLDAHRGIPTPWASLTHLLRLNAIFPKSKVFNQYFLGWLDLNTSHEIGACIFHFMFCRLSVLKKLNGFDEDYFLYGEDIDLCYRVSNLNFSVMYLPQWRTLHYKGAGVGRKTSLDLNTFSSQLVSTQNIVKKGSVAAMKIFYKKHFVGKNDPILVFLVLMGINFLGFLRSRK